MDGNVLKHIFYYLLRWERKEKIKDAFLMLSLTCKHWNKILNTQLQLSDVLKMDERFGYLLEGMAHNYDLPCFYSYFNYIVNTTISDVIPIDHCIYCGKLRYLLDEDSWCNEVVGCHKWICSQRIDSFKDRCYYLNCSLYSPSEEKVLKRAYYIYLNTGRDDALANYYQAYDEEKVW